MRQNIVPTPIETEFNNNEQTAISMNTGDTIHGDIASDEDVDLYVLKVLVSQVLDLTFTTQGATGDFAITLQSLTPRKRPIKNELWKISKTGQKAWDSN